MIDQTVGLGLMCKPPRPGVTKTRLAAAIGPEAAADLSRAFLEDCALAAREAAALCRLDLTAYYRPDDAADEIEAILGPDWSLVHADAGELGATMREVLIRLLRRYPAGAMIMGADVPLIGSQAIAAAAQALCAMDERGIVLIPSADGGYCLLGVRSEAAADSLCAPMAWSTPSVLQETLRRAAAVGLTVHQLPMQRDIDEAGDLDWLREEIRQGADHAPSTARAIAALAANRSVT